MGSLFSKTNSWRRCRECTRNVKLFERVCCLCAAAAKRMELPAVGSDRPLFGEYLCIACETGWTSRLCWPCHYQACKRCQQIVYPHNWRDLKPADLKREAMSKDHQREDCQKCLEPETPDILIHDSDVVVRQSPSSQFPRHASDGTRNNAETTQISCSCGDNKQNTVEDTYDDMKYNNDAIADGSTFPSSDQIWGMVGTLLAIGAVWMLFTRLKRGREAALLPPPQILQQRKNENQQPVASKSSNPTKTTSRTSRCK